MSRSVNKVILVGNVGNEPEIRTTAGGKRVARLSLATSRTFNDRNGQKQEKTEWHRLVAWDKTCDIVEQYVHKGDRLYIEGTLEYSQAEHEGVTRYYTDVIVREMVMLGGGSGEGKESRPTAAAAAAAAPSPFADDDDDLPF